MLLPVLCQYSFLKPIKAGICFCSHSSCNCLDPRLSLPVRPGQVQLAETMLRAEGGAVAGLSAVSRIQLLPGDLRYPRGAAADSGAAHWHQAAAVWVLETVWHHLNKYKGLLVFGWGQGGCSICGPGWLCLFPQAIKIQCVWVGFKTAIRFRILFVSIIWRQQAPKLIL